MAEVDTSALQMTAEQLRSMPLEDIVPLLNPETILDVIFKLDENSLSVSERDTTTGEWINPDADILLDKQGYASGGAASLTDAAPNPLFYRVSEKALSTRSFKAFAAMFDNYDAYVNRKEHLGPVEMAEINELLDAILETKCMKIALLYINKFLGENFTLETFRDKLFRMWFYLHTLVLRAGKVPRAVRMRLLRFEAASRERVKNEVLYDQRKAEYAQAQKKLMAYIAQRQQAHPEHDVNAFDEAEQTLQTNVENARIAMESAEKALEATLALLKECQDTEAPGDDPDDAKEGIVDYCSGFEHVFLGEISIQANESVGHVLGYHSWLKFYFDERAQLIDYLGTKFAKNSIANAGAPFMCVKFRWDQDGLVFVKERGSFFVGCSPEFSIAVATVCFFETESPERVERCHWELKSEDRYMRMRLIDGFKFDYYICKHKEYLVSCFEELIGVCEERRARKRQQKLVSEPIVRKPRVKVETEWKKYCRENMRRLQAENPGLSDREAYALLKSQFDTMMPASVSSNTTLAEPVEAKVVNSTEVDANQ